MIYDHCIFLLIILLFIKLEYNKIFKIALLISNKIKKLYNFFLVIKYNCISKYFFKNLLTFFTKVNTF